MNSKPNDVSVHVLLILLCACNGERMKMNEAGTSQFASHDKSSAVADANPLRMLPMVLLAGSAGGFHLKPTLYSQHPLPSRYSPAVRAPQLGMEDAPRAKISSAGNMSDGDHVLKELPDYTAWQIPRKEFLSHTTAALIAGVSANLAAADASIPQGSIPLYRQRASQGSIDSGLVLYSTQKESFRIALGETLVPTLKARPDTRVICVGEEHPHPLHHAFQLNVIKAVDRMDASPTLIGLEMCWREHQAALDDFVFGDVRSGGGSIEMLENRTRWLTNWGWSIKLYADIFNYAREKRIRLVGLNAPSPIVSLVGRRGLKEAYSMLNAETLSSMPEVELDNKEHFQRFKDRLGSVSDLSALSSTRFQNMYEAQSLWDEYMAASIAKYFSHAPQQSMSRMVVLAGVGHLQGRVGIPDRVEKRTSVKTYTVVPISVPWPGIGSGGFPDVHSTGSAFQDVSTKGPVSPKEGDWVLYTRKFEDLDTRWRVGGTLEGGWVNA